MTTTTRRSPSASTGRATRTASATQAAKIPENSGRAAAHPDARAVLDSAISEKQFQANVVRLAKLHRWLCYHTHDSRHSEPGFPDLVLCRDGVLIFAELKRQTGRVSAAQRVWMQHLSLVAGVVGASGVHGAIQVYLWKPADWETIARVLSGGDGRTAKGAA